MKSHDSHKNKDLSSYVHVNPHNRTTTSQPKKEFSVNCKKGAIVVDTQAREGKKERPVMSVTNFCIKNRNDHVVVVVKQKSSRAVP